MKKFDSINVIPFIDIMLVLLAIVLTSATFIARSELDITLPAASADSTPDESERLEIAVDKEGLLYINADEHTLEQAEQILSLLDENMRIVLMIDESVEFGKFVQVVDLLKRLSLNKVSVMTRTGN